VEVADEQALVADMIKSKKVGVVLRHAPYGNSFAQEALDATLAMSLFGQEMTLIFLGDGVFQLLKHQQAAGIHQKTFSKQIAVFELYDIERIFVCTQSLAHRNISPASLCIDVTGVAPAEIKVILHEQDTLLSF
jgi:tRNA 2-thiouridine synthesizing protein C